ncbi:DUF305 domain-containing protein [Phytohabitans sp. LJ34]|uniref:DUF305 domain-containing protein n=1 Tax=Phytohabitans sp. LJ34 TaxID=3452217 RepID=UPI003F8ACACA
MMTEQQMAALTAAAGPAPTRLYLEQMIEPHNGAILMAKGYSPWGATRISATSPSTSSTNRAPRTTSCPSCWQRRPIRDQRGGRAGGQIGGGSASTADVAH